MAIPREISTKRPVVRTLVIWVIQTLALITLTLLLDGLTVDRVGTALLAVAVISLLNALLWPLLSSLLLPLTVITLGLFSFVLNGFIIWLAGQFVDGFYVSSIWTAILTTLGLTTTNLIVSSLLSIDDEGYWYRNVVQRRMKRRDSYIETDIPGVLFLEIDGLAKPVFQRVIREGYMPNLARWLESGSHSLVEWETDLSSQI
jgi:uncharacterized membrane protein YvlD (DUF360 family)